MRASTVLEELTDRLGPKTLGDQDQQRNMRIRLFLLSHFFGPLLALPVPAFLFFVDPHPYPHVHVLALSIVSFWLYPLLLRVLPSLYTAWALVSISNLNFTVLWGAYHYGGGSSPFLIWYTLLPLLSFFYLGGGRRTQLLVLAQIFLGLGIFTELIFRNGFGEPSRLQHNEIFVSGIISTILSTIYILFMASYYAAILDSRSELIKEISRHKATLDMLRASKEEADQAKFLVEARNKELEAAKENLEFVSLHDSLTGLPNRRYLDQEMLKNATWCHQNDESLALFHIDLDGFKQVNDTLGHGAGDAMLVHTANLLRSSIDKDDFLARIGGDEFIIARRSEESVQRLTRLAQHITDLIRQPVPYGNHFCRFGASVGIALARGHDVDANRLLVDADLALYRAKEQGRSRVEFFSQELQVQIARTKLVADEILTGLERDEFLAFYQPQFDARTFQLIGAEALVRWNHPSKGILPPAAFLDVADDLNVVAEIDRLVLLQAIRDMEDWAGAGLSVPKISVNVSLKRLNGPDLISSLKRLNIRPNTITFELVEAIFLDEADDTVVSNIENLKKLGIEIEIDDFGSGHASIIGLLKLRPKQLKIDRHFITRILDFPERARLVESIVEIGRSLGIQVAAEGVETMQEAYLLREIGCDVLQGYVFSPPIAAPNFKEFVRTPPTF